MTTLAEDLAQKNPGLFLSTGPPRQDFIVLAGKKSPGRAVIKGAGSPRKWDIREGYGLSGATCVYGGDKLSQFSVEIALFDERAGGDWDDWEVFAKVLEKPPAGVRPKAMDIRHPQLNRAPLKITSVSVEDVSQWEQDDNGLWTCEIKFLQFRAPKPVLAKPVASTPDTNGTPKALDAIDIQTNLLQAQVFVAGAQLNGGRP